MRSTRSRRGALRGLHGVGQRIRREVDVLPVQHVPPCSACLWNSAWRTEGEKVGGLLRDCETLRSWHKTYIRLNVGCYRAMWVILLDCRAMWKLLPVQTHWYCRFCCALIAFQGFKVQTYIQLRIRSFHRKIKCTLSLSMLLLLLVVVVVVVVLLSSSVSSSSSLLLLLLFMRTLGQPFILESI